MQAIGDLHVCLSLSRRKRQSAHVLLATPGRHVEEYRRAAAAADDSAAAGNLVEIGELDPKVDGVFVWKFPF